MKNIKLLKTGIFLVGITMIAISCTTQINNESIKVKLSEKPSQGEMLFNTKCTSCHSTTKPADKSKMLAPPIMGVMKHVKGGIEGKNDAEKRMKAIDFIVDYVQFPDSTKSLVEKHAIERFGIMPSQKENISPEEITLVANYLYDNYGNGKGGCGSACGGACRH